MKQFLFTLVVASCAWAESSLAAAKNVYLTPMSGGLDQYLALQLTKESVLQVVTDSSKADLVFADRVGEDFKQMMAELDGKTQHDQPVKAGEVPPFTRPSMRPLSKARGTIFLVDRHTGDLVWSTLEQPKSTSVDDLNAAAKRIAGDLKKALKTKTASTK
jgi:hypothetical protein